MWQRGRNESAMSLGPMSPKAASAPCTFDTTLSWVKKPAESKGPWDYYKTRATTPAEQAFRPIDQGDCPLVKK